MIERFKKLGKDTAIYGVSNAVVSLVGLILTPVLTRIFTPSDYGAIDLALSVVSLLSLVLMLGLDSAMILGFYQTQNGREQKQIVSTGFYFLSAFAFAATLALGFFAAPLASAIFKNARYAAILSLGLWVAFFTIINTYVGHLLRIRLQPRRYLYLMNVKVLLTVGLVMFFVLPMRLGIAGVLYGYLAANAAAAALGLVFTAQNYIASFSRERLRSLLAVGTPLIFASLSVWVLGLSSRFFLSRYLDLEQVGFYSLASKISQVLMVAAGGFQLAFSPYAYSIHRQGDAKRFFSKVLTYFTVAACGMALALALFANVIVLAVSGPQYFPAIGIVGLLCLAMAAYGSYNIVALGVSLAQKTIHIAWTTVAAAALNIALSFVLIPRFGITGAAVASLVSYCASALFLYRESQRCYPIPFRGLAIAAVWGITAILMAAGGLIATGSEVFDAGLKLAVFAFFAVIVLIFKIVAPSDVAALIQVVKQYFNRQARR